MTVSSVLCDSGAEVLFEPLPALFFPKVAHRLSRTIRHQTPLLNLVPEMNAARLMSKLRVGKGDFKDLDALSQGVLNFASAEFNTLAVLLLVSVSKEGLFR